jgi:hypothetical protein
VRAGAAEPAPTAATIDVWVDLQAPPPTDGAPAAVRIGEQQDRVMRELRMLGAVELARVRHARNAIAVRLPREQIDAVHRIAGVVRVRPLDTLHPPRTAPSP